MIFAERVAQLRALDGQVATLNIRYPKVVRGKYEVVDETHTGLIRMIGTRSIAVSVGRVTTLVAYVTEVTQ